jgi:hypothetical protein
LFIASVNADDKGSGKEEQRSRLAVLPEGFDAPVSIEKTWPCCLRAGLRPVAEIIQNDYSPPRLAFAGSEHQESAFVARHDVRNAIR